MLFIGTTFIIRNVSQADPSLAKKGTAAVYGMTANIPSKTVVDSFLLEFFSEMYTP